ncbi:MAG: M48 family metallopeptidase [Magnetospiraceae bacterium]
MTFPAVFHDGKTAASYPVTLRFGINALSAADDNHHLHANWTYTGLTLVDRVDAEPLVRLSHATAPEARLVVRGREAIRALEKAAPKAFGKRGLGWRLTGWAVAALIATVVFIGVLISLLPNLAGLVAHTVPQEYAALLGEAYAEQLVSEAAGGPAVFCDDGGAGVLALAGMTERLSRGAGPDHLFQVRVADADMVNAFALPGGHVVIFRGLLDAAESPEEVAGVLAHEMGHVIERHPLRALFESLGLQGLSWFLLGDNNWGALVTAGVQLSFSRSDEEAADEIAIDLLGKAGIDPRGLVDFFRRLHALEEEQGGALPALFSTHPSTEDRLARLADLKPTGGPAMAPDQWRALQHICN